MVATVLPEGSFSATRQRYFSEVGECIVKAAEESVRAGPEPGGLAPKSWEGENQGDACLKFSQVANVDGSRKRAICGLFAAMLKLLNWFLIDDCRHALA